MTPKVGDWIRFVHGGVIVVDVVVYLVQRSRYDSTIEALTVSHGQVPFSSILELRSDHP